MASTFHLDLPFSSFYQLIAIEFLEALIVMGWEWLYHSYAS